MLYLACSRLQDRWCSRSVRAGSWGETGQWSSLFHFFRRPFPISRASYFRLAHFKYVPTMLSESLAQAMLYCI